MKNIKKNKELVRMALHEPNEFIKTLPIKVGDCFKVSSVIFKITEIKVLDEILHGQDLKDILEDDEDPEIFRLQISDFCGEAFEVTREIPYDGKGFSVIKDYPDDLFQEWVLSGEAEKITSEEYEEKKTKILKILKELEEFYDF